MIRHSGSGQWRAIKTSVIGVLDLLDCASLTLHLLVPTALPQVLSSFPIRKIAAVHKHQAGNQASSHHTSAHTCLYQEFLPRVPACPPEFVSMQLSNLGIFPSFQDLHHHLSRFPSLQDHFSLGTLVFNTTLPLRNSKPLIFLQSKECMRPIVKAQRPPAPSWVVLFHVLLITAFRASHFSLVQISSNFTTGLNKLQWPGTGFCLTVEKLRYEHRHTNLFICYTLLPIVQSSFSLTTFFFFQQIIVMTSSRPLKLFYCFIVLIN